MEQFNEQCFCGRDTDPRRSIQLFVGPGGDGLERRFYLPALYNRQAAARGEAVHLYEVRFCRSCMRKLEDSLNAIIATAVGDTS